MPEADRTIFHVDMDAFFAAIAVLDDPSLKGKAVLTGGNGRRGVVTTASYEARKFGCRSAMPTSQALRLCPHAICVKVPGDRIRQKSQEVLEVFKQYSPSVQPLSVDEAFLDMTGSERLLGPPEEVAAKLKRDIKQQTGLTASVGVAFNKFLAKLASDLEKPDGLTVITRKNLDAVLLPLPVGKVWGIGPATQRKLERHHIQTVGDLRKLSQDRLNRLFGEYGERFYRLCRGIDNRPVTPDRRAKSIGHEQTFGENLDSPELVRTILLDQAEQVGRRLRAHGFTARGLSVKIRYGDFQTITRSTVLDPPTDLSRELYRAGRGLFDKWASTQFSPVRLIGLSASPLQQGPAPAGLFPEPEREKQSQLDQALDRITEKFGKRTVHRGVHQNRTRR
jgi:DNA polymerase-4